VFDELRQHFDQIEIFCGIFTVQDGQGGFAIDSRLLGRMAEVGIDLVFDIY
jgi:hypothetical protein